MNHQPSFPYTGAPIYIDFAATGSQSPNIVTRGLINGLRENNVPAFALGFDKDDPEFYLGRHLATSPKPWRELEAYDYTYVDCGLPQARQLTLMAKQSVVMTVVDDFRWNLAHTQHVWKAFDSVLTISKFSQRYLTEKLKRPIGYFPLGVDSKVFHPIAHPRLPVLSKDDIEFKNFPFDLQDIIGKVYIYMSVGYMQDRKGIKELLHAYFQAFYGQPDVLLWIHGPKGNWSDDRVQGNLGIFTNPTAPMVIWTKKKLLQPELTNLFNLADCYVSPHHLEGFGLGPLQALACRKPVIATAFAGPMDYLPSTGVKLVPCKEIVAFVHKDLDLMPWAEYKQDDLIDALKFPPKEPPPASVAETWTWKRAAKVFLTHIKVYGKITPISKGVTICIPCWKDWQNLHKLLTSLASTPAGLPFKIIVCNDGNTPEVSTTCQRFRVKEVIIEQSIGLGFVRNVLMSNVNTEYMIYMDCDIVITTPHWLSEWLFAHKKLGPRAISSILQFTPDGKINFAGHHTIGQPSYYYHQPAATGAFQHRKVIYAQGSMLMMKTSFAQSIGFCEDYKLYYDDVDFCLYCQQHGGSIHYLPVTSAIHSEHSMNKVVGATPIDDGKIGRDIFMSYWGTKTAVDNSVPYLRD